MRKRWMPCLLLLAAQTAAAQVDLSTLDAEMPGPRTQVLVLGSVHLSGMPKDFKLESLDPVLDKLAAFEPGVITIEAISGEQCDLAARYPTIYGETLADYCADPAMAEATTGLDVPAAIDAVRNILRDWPTAPTPAQRRHLAALFLAANDCASALVQWLQLADPERRAGDGLDAALTAQLDALATKNNESYQIGARLAARLGLQRVFAIDDHTGDSGEVPDQVAYGKAVQQAWDIAKPAAQPMRDHDEALRNGDDMLALYRYVNRPDVQRIAIDSDFAAALRDPSAEHYGRLYVTGWETRNLRMLANVYFAFGEHPGARVLSIVGASHKPWFDGLLGQMQGVDIVDVEAVLRASTDPTTSR